MSRPSSSGKSGDWRNPELLKFTTAKKPPGISLYDDEDLYPEQFIRKDEGFKNQFRDRQTEYDTQINSPKEASPIDLDRYVIPEEITQPPSDSSGHSRSSRFQDDLEINPQQKRSNVAPDLDDWTADKYVSATLSANKPRNSGISLKINPKQSGHPAGVPKCFSVDDSNGDEEEKRKEEYELSKQDKLKDSGTSVYKWHADSRVLENKCRNLQGPGSDAPVLENKGRNLQAPSYYRPNVKDFSTGSPSMKTDVDDQSSSHYADSPRNSSSNNCLSSVSKEREVQSSSYSADNRKEMRTHSPLRYGGSVPRTFNDQPEQKLQDSGKTSFVSDTKRMCVEEKTSKDDTKLSAVEEKMSTVDTQRLAAEDNRYAGNKGQSGENKRSIQVHTTTRMKEEHSQKQDTFPAAKSGYGYHPPPPSYVPQQPQTYQNQYYGGNQDMSYVAAPTYSRSLNYPDYSGNYPGQPQTLHTEWMNETHNPYHPPQQMTQFHQPQFSHGNLKEVPVCDAKTTSSGARILKPSNQSEAVRKEIKQYNDNVSIQRADYYKKKHDLSKRLDELKLEKEQLQRSKQSSETHSRLKQNSEEQAEVNNKLKAVNNVIEMLSKLLAESTKGFSSGKEGLPVSYSSVKEGYARSSKLRSPERSSAQVEREPMHKRDIGRVAAESNVENVDSRSRRDPSREKEYSNTMYKNSNFRDSKPKDISQGTDNHVGRNESSSRTSPVSRSSSGSLTPVMEHSEALFDSRRQEELVVEKRHIVDESPRYRQENTAAVKRPFVDEISKDVEEVKMDERWKGSSSISEKKDSNRMPELMTSVECAPAPRISEYLKPARTKPEMPPDPPIITPPEAPSWSSVNDVISNRDRHASPRSLAGSKDGKLKPVEKESELGLENKKLSETPSKQEEEEKNYAFYDPEIHWCKACNVFPRTAKDYLLHLHSPEHKDTLKQNNLADFPWHKDQPETTPPVKPGAPTERVPIRGLQFLVSATAWFCKLCDQWIGDLHCASAHLKSKQHRKSYHAHMAKNPYWEVDWLATRMRAYEDFLEKRNQETLSGIKTEREEEKEKNIAEMKSFRESCNSDVVSTFPPVVTRQSEERLRKIEDYKGKKQKVEVDLNQKSHKKRKTENESSLSSESESEQDDKLLEEWLQPVQKYGDKDFKDLKKKIKKRESSKEKERKKGSKKSRRYHETSESEESDKESRKKINQKRHSGERDAAKRRSRDRGTRSRERDAAKRRSRDRESSSREWDTAKRRSRDRETRSRERDAAKRRSRDRESSSRERDTVKRQSRDRGTRSRSSRERESSKESRKRAKDAEVEKESKKYGKRGERNRDSDSGERDYKKEKKKDHGSSKKSSDEKVRDSERSSSKKSRFDKSEDISSKNVEKKNFFQEGPSKASHIDSNEGSVQVLQEKVKNVEDKLSFKIKNHDQKILDGPKLAKAKFPFIGRMPFAKNLKKLKAEAEKNDSQNLVSMLEGGDSVSSPAADIHQIVFKVEKVGNETESRKKDFEETLSILFPQEVPRMSEIKMPKQADKNASKDTISLPTDISTANLTDIALPPPPQVTNPVTVYGPALPNVSLVAPPPDPIPVPPPSVSMPPPKIQNQPVHWSNPPPLSVPKSHSIGPVLSVNTQQPPPLPSTSILFPPLPVQQCPNVGSSPSGTQVQHSASESSSTSENGDGKKKKNPMSQKKRQRLQKIKEKLAEQEKQLQQKIEETRKKLEIEGERNSSEERDNKQVDSMEICAIGEGNTELDLLGIDAEDTVFNSFF